MESSEEGLIHGPEPYLSAFVHSVDENLEMLVLLLVHRLIHHACNSFQGGIRVSV